MNKRFSVSAYVRAVVDGQLKVLLVQHKKRNMYVPIGGRIEPGESPFDAVQREIKEEIGRDDGVFPIVVPNLWDKQPVGMIGYDEHDAGNDRWHMNFSFVYDLPDTHISACSEWTDPIWITDAALTSPINVVHFVRRALEAPRHYYNSKVT